MDSLHRREFLQISATLCLTGFGRLGEAQVVDPQTSGLVPVEGAQLRYFIEGEGLPCLVLGHAESQRLLLSEALRSHFRFHFLDLRHDAASESSLDLTRLTLDTYLEDVDAARRFLGLESTAVFGHSHHAWVAFEYARKCPQHVTHVIMTGCVPHNVSREVRDEFWESDASEERKAAYEQNLLDEPDDEEWDSLTPHERWLSLYQGLAPRMLYDPTGDVTRYLEPVYNDDEVFPHYQSLLHGYDVATRPGPVLTPVFLAVGRFDYGFPYYLWDDRREVIPNLSYHVFEKSGHFPMVEEQELFDQKLVDWLTRTVAS